jgi:hypothetical protein
MTKILLVRFEKKVLHYIISEIDKDLIIIDKNKISFNDSLTDWEKYKKILDELLIIKEKYDIEEVLYQWSLKPFRWCIDEVRYWNECILDLFCYQNRIECLKLNKNIVAKKVWIKLKDVNILLERKKIEIVDKYKITKSDILIEILILVLIIKF